MSGSFFAHFKLPGGVRRRIGFLLPLLLLACVLAACGESASNSAAFSNSNQTTSGQPAATPGSGGGATAGPPTLPNGTPVTNYLIRTLSVSLVVAEPLKVVQQISQDMLNLDPLSQGSGEQINQQDDGTYKVSITFAVSAAKYEQVKTYLGGFSKDNQNPAYVGELVSENESVQNVTGQYVDLQSRLKNLQTEQQRLLQLMSQAQNLSDTLTLQDKLTDVEGQIEQIEGQINDLAGQTAYSMVTINLSSTPPAPKTTPSTSTQKWSPGDIFSAAVSVMVAVLQVVLDILIWVAVFAVFWLPILAGYYLWRRRQRSVKPGASGVGAP
jgi:hypothetical protein